MLKCSQTSTSGYDKFVTSFDGNLTPYFAAIICVWGMDSPW
jgi:hypothetical protein